MLAQIENLGAIGLNSDLAPWQLPTNAWTALGNMRCADGQVGSFSGHDDFTTPTVVPHYLMAVASGASYFWLYPSTAKVYVYDGASHTDITRSSGGDYSKGTARWNGCTINGIPVINNVNDDPQMWLPTNTSTMLQKITGWNSNWKAKVIRSYKGFLFALDITKSGTNYPYMVKWSASDTSGSIPTDWDETSTTNDAGENQLGETPGLLVDAVKLRDALMIYKEDAVYGVQWVGGISVHRFYRISGLTGALAQDCAVEFASGQHFVLASGGKCYVHDGQNSRTVNDKVNQDFLKSAIDSDNYANCFVTQHHAASEVWVCYPEGGETYPNKALVWNYEDNTWGSRDLPSDTTFIAPGIVADSVYTWDTLPYATWDTWDGVWGSRSYSPVSASLVGCTANTKLYQFDNEHQFDSVNPYCYAERIGLDLGNCSDLHTITQVYPHIESGDVDIDVWVGSQMSIQDTVTWEGPYSFNPSTGRKIDCRVTGVRHAIRYSTEADVSWALTGYDVEYARAGKR